MYWLRYKFNFNSELNYDTVNLWNICYKPIEGFVWGDNTEILKDTHRWHKLYNGHFYITVSHIFKYIVYGSPIMLYILKCHISYYSVFYVSVPSKTLQPSTSFISLRTTRSVASGNPRPASILPQCLPLPLTRRAGLDGGTGAREGSHVLSLSSSLPVTTQELSS